MIKCIIIDDEQHAIDVIKSYIMKLPALELVGEATNPLVGLDLIKKHNADLVFLDIQMGQMNGLEVKKAISKEIDVIFCTAYPEFAVASYELDTVDYLMKPISFDRFVKAVQRVNHTNNVVSQIVIPEEIFDDYFFIKTGQKGSMVRIDFDDIDYIKSMNNYVEFNKKTGKVLAYLSTGYVEDRLPSNKFVRVHKSYIVAIKQIIALENSTLTIKGYRNKIPLSSSYREAFMEKMKSKVLQFTP